MLVISGIELLIASGHTASRFDRDGLSSCHLVFGAKHVIFSRLSSLYDGATICDLSIFVMTRLEC